MAVKEEQPIAVSEERNKALKLAIEKIEKDFGKGSIMKLGDKPAVNVEAIPTGSLALDIALGIGGVFRGLLFQFLQVNQGLHLEILLLFLCPDQAFHRYS